MSNLKKTAFYDLEAKFNARFTDFGGWDLPVRYTSQVEEHLAVRNSVGVFDVSHMGEIFITGKDALKQVNWLVTNDVANLVDNQILYTPMMNKKGGVVDDLLVYRYNDEKFLLVVNAANIEKDFSWMLKNNKYNCKIENLSENYVQLAVQGPKSEETLQKLFTNIKLNEIKYYNFVVANYNNQDIILSRTGYTGEDGFELYFKENIAEEIWNKIFEYGKDFDIKPIGLGARDTLRLEKKMALYGHELTDEINPIEASLKWTVKLDKEEFIGKEEVLNLSEKGKLQRKLVGLELIDKGIPRHGSILKNENGENIGFVTSGTQSPSLNKPIALAMVNKGYFKLGTEVFLELNNKLRKATIVKTPFL
jgi:aminomethyltransferase